MTTNILYRTSSPLIRADSNEGRIIFGRAIPYGVVAEVSDGYQDYAEMWEYGAFARSIRERGSKVKLLVQHDKGQLPIGRAVELTEKPDGLHASFAVAATRDGDDALELVRSGVVDAFSIGFIPKNDRQEKGVTVRTEAALMEVSLVGFPAFPGALIGGVRSGATGNKITVDVASRRLDLILLETEIHHGN